MITGLREDCAARLEAAVLERPPRNQANLGYPDLSDAWGSKNIWLNDETNSPKLRFRVNKLKTKVEAGGKC